MDRRKIIIIISIITIIALFGGAYWYLSKKGVLQTPNEMFPGEAGRTPGEVGEATPKEEPFTLEPGSPLPRLHELHKTPVAGAGFIEEGSGSSRRIAVRYIERGLGYIFETPLSTYVESRIVNETRPRTIEALWGNNGRSVVLRSVDGSNDGIIKTRIVNIGAPTVSFARSTSTESTANSFLKTEEVYLPSYIPFMATSEDGADQLFYLESGSSASAGSVLTFRGANVSKIFSSSFTEWLPQFPNQALVTLTTKPSATVPGHLFFVDQKTKLVSKILGGINGLTTLTNHNGRFVLYSETRGKAPELSLYDTPTKKSHSLYIKTLPEKCVWGKKGASVLYCAVPQSIVPAEYPDQWYQGLIAFSDDLWEINTKTLSANKIMSPMDFGAPSLDIINPTLSSDDGYLLFMNKLTGTPWVYRISEEQPVAVAPTLATSTTSTMSTTTKTLTPPSVITPDMKKLK